MSKNNTARIRCLIWTAVLLFSITFIGIAAFAESTESVEGATIEEVFTYRYCINPEVSEQEDFDKSMLIYEVPEKCSDYVSRLLAYCRDCDYRQTENGLCFTCERVLAVDGLFALQWTVENISDESLILNSDWMAVNGEIGGGRGSRPMNTLLNRGEILRFTTATLLPDYTETKGDLQINISILDENENEIGVSSLRQTAECVFTPIMGLPDGETLEIPWRNGMLRVTEAKQNLGMGSYTVLLIFDSQEQAMANDPCSDESGWNPGLFCDSALTDDGWFAIGGGDIADVPIELPDGRWAFSFHRTAEFMNWIPDTVYIAPCPNWGEADQTAVIRINLSSGS